VPYSEGRQLPFAGPEKNFFQPRGGACDLIPCYVVSMLSPNVHNLVLELFNKGENVTQALVSRNIPVDFQIIELLYDLQAGTYTSLTEANVNNANSYVKEIADLIEPYSKNLVSILDCGTGEANTLVELIKRLPNLSNVFAIDASWSRLSWAKQNLESAEVDNCSLAVADLKNIPLQSGLIDIVFTSHALEPNGGSEQVILNELSRVGKKYIILIEPDYLMASQEQRTRMESLQYIGDLRPFFTNAGLKLIKYYELENSTNPMNRSSLFVLEKLQGYPSKHNQERIDWVDPADKSKGRIFGSGLRFKSGLWYPVLQGIPFLRIFDGKHTHSPAKEN